METIDTKTLYAEIIKESFAISVGGNAEITDKHIAKFDVLGQWLTNPRKGWLFLGNPGSGKSTLLEAIVKVIRNTESTRIADRVSDKHTEHLVNALREKFKDYYIDGDYKFGNNEKLEDEWYEGRTEIVDKQVGISRIVHEALEDIERNLIFTTSRDICLFANRKGRDAMFNGENSLGNIPVLIIDDLGNAAEPKSVKYYGKDEDGNIINEEIFPIIELIEHRYEKSNGIMLLSSNLDMEKLVERYGEPIVDRIMEVCYKGLWEFDSYRRKFSQSPGEKVNIKRSNNYDNLMENRKDSGYRGARHSGQDW